MEGRNRMRATLIAGLAGGLVLAAAAPATAAPVPSPLVHAYGWGGNAFGQLGDGTTTDHPSPTRIAALPATVRQVAAGNDFKLALLADGTVLAWGQNSVGQLGDGTQKSRATPAPVPGL